MKWALACGGKQSGPVLQPRWSYRLAPVATEKLIALGETLLIEKPGGGGGAERCLL